MKILLILNFIVPFVMLLIGYLLKRYPKPNIGSNGYSTPSSRKSQDRWDYAQAVAPTVFIFFGKALFIIISLLNVLFLFIPIDINKSITIGNIVGFSVLGISFFVIENKISTRFGKQ